MVIIPSGWASHSRKRERSFTGEPLRGSHILRTARASRFALRAKTVQNTAFGAKTSRYSSQNSNFWIQNLNFKPLLALRTPNITYMKRGRRGGLHRRETRRTTVQNSAKQWFWRQNDRYSSQNSNFWIQKLNFKPLLALLISNITYMKRLPGMGKREASTDEKTAKNSEKQRNGHFWRQE